MLRPRSILQLVLIGVGIVTIPLLAAFIVTALFVNDLSRSGQQAIVRATDVIQQSRSLVEHAVALERNGRQYLVLNDPAVASVYMQRRADLRQVAGELRARTLTDAQHLLLDQLDRRELDLYQRLLKRDANNEASPVAPWEFAGLTSLARGVLAESGQLITRNIQALNDSANRIHRLLFWESIAVVPVALGLGGIFVLLIIRPLRPLHSAIERLGSGRFDEPVSVRGPRDLQKLGVQLESTRKRLQALEGQKVFFLRNISHELKTPLTTLREGTQLLGDEVAGTLNVQQRDIVDLLGRNCILLQRLIEDLLHFGVSPASSLEPHSRRIELACLIEEVLDEQRLPARARGVSFDSELTPIEVRGDPSKLKTVFSNLVSNAIKFSNRDTPVRATLNRREPWAVFELRDSGPGVSSEDKKHIFEAFYQGQAQSDGPVKGSGLGLFIAREFVQLHQGTIDVLDSDGGAHLRVRLPLDTADRAATEPAAVDDVGADIGLLESDPDAGRSPGTAGT